MSYGCMSQRQLYQEARKVWDIECGRAFAVGAAEVGRDGDLLYCFHLRSKYLRTQKLFDRKVGRPLLH